MHRPKEPFQQVFPQNRRNNQSNWNRSFQNHRPAPGPIRKNCNQTWRSTSNSKRSNRNFETNPCEVEINLTEIGSKKAPGEVNLILPGMELKVKISRTAGPQQKGFRKSSN